MIFVISAGCAATASAYSEEDVVYITEQYLSSWIATDFGEYLNAGITDEAAIEQFTSWQNLKDNMGELESVSEYQITEEDGVLVVSETLVCTNDTIVFSVSFDKETAEVDAYSAVMEIHAVSGKAVDAEGASIAKAGLNTIMSMAIVFTVLIFIAVIIYLMRYIPVILDKITGSGTKVEEPETSSEIVQSPITEEKVSEEELAAVITAAVMAYEAETGAAPGSFVVRSIKRRGR